MSSSPTPPLHAVRIDDRSPSHGSWFSWIFFPIVFNAGIISINLTQLIFYPLTLFPPTQDLYTRLLLYTKEAFVRLLILISLLFGPTKLILTAGEGIDLDQVVEREGKTGRVKGLRLPKRVVVVGNHQAYSDWMYLWILAYYARASDGIYILLKKSLKWIPLIGWAMQLYDFIFLSRSWALDQRPLSLHLKRLARRSIETKQPIWIMLFPEGTIGSDNERPKSIKWAEKEGIPDLTNMLLPRSLGLYTILTTLLPSFPPPLPLQPNTSSSHSTRIPSPSSSSSSSSLLSSSQTQPSPNECPLPILDCTIGYPGVPPAAYAQEYYSLFSIFHRSVPPPAVHIHLRMYNSTQILALTSIPPPKLTITTSQLNARSTSSSFSNHSKSGSTLNTRTVAEEVGDEVEAGRRRRFGEWLTGIWREKDELMDEFYATGRFPSKDSVFDEEMTRKGRSGGGGSGRGGESAFGEQGVEVPVGWRDATGWKGWKEAGDAMCWLIPVWVGWAVVWAMGRWVGSV